MKTERFEIGAVPAALYGEPAERGWLFLHGQMGCKEEAEPFARAACRRGYQVLSIDLPGHGERRGRGGELTPWAAAPDVRAALDWAEGRWNTVSLRANSIGAYFAMLSFDAPDKALLVSPVLDMEGLILAMMGRAGVTEDELQKQGEIAVPFGQPLSWEYLCWVREHPVCDWPCPIHVLWGSCDNMTSRRMVERFAGRHHVRLTVVDGGGHWLHTPEQMALLRAWESGAC